MVAENTRTLEITRMSIKTGGGKTVKLETSAIAEMSIFESLTAPGITGYFLLQDWQGAKELGEIFAGDMLELEWKTEGRKPIVSTLVICGSSGDEILERETFNYTKMFFCSPWIVDGFVRQVSKPYTKKFIHEIVIDLIKECGGEIGIVESTMQQLEHFVSPLWTPIHTIKHLMGFAKNKTNQGGYVLWTDLATGKVNFTTLSYLMGGGIIVPEENKDLFNIRSHSQRFEGKVYEQSIESHFDIIKAINLGMNHTEVHAFHYDKTKIIKTNSNIKDYKHNHLSTKLPVNAKYLDIKYKNIRHTSLYPNSAAQVNTAQEPTDLIEGYLNNHYSLIFSDIIKINLMVNPASHRRVGTLARLFYPSIEKNKTEENKQLTGNYLIREIRHMFQNGEYFHALTLCGDGYKQLSRTDLIEWSSGDINAS